MIIATSFWYLAELAFSVAENRFEPSRPGLTEELVVAAGRTFQDLRADKLVNIAKGALPGFKPTQIQFAQMQNQAVTVLGRMKDPIVRQRANRVFINPVSGEVIRAQKSTELGWVAYINEIADPLHFGTFGSVWTKAIWFLFGLVMVCIALSGVWLSWQRLGLQALSKVQWGSLPLLLAITSIGIYYVRDHTRNRLPEFSVVVEETRSNGLNTTLEFETDSENFVGDLRLLITNANWRLNISSVMISVNGLDESQAIKARSLGSTVAFNAHVPVSILEQADSIQATICFGSGELETFTFQIPRSGA